MECAEIHTVQIKCILVFQTAKRRENMSAHNATHVLFRASPPNYIDSQQLRKLPESFLRGGLACRSVPVRLKLAEAVKRQAHYLTGYLRGQWAWVKMALIKMEWTCLGSCETLSGVGWGGSMHEPVRTLTYLCLICVCVCVCLQFHKAISGCLDVCVRARVWGLLWKHVLAASRVNVRRTWGRSHYHPPSPPFC